MFEHEGEKITKENTRNISQKENVQKKKTPFRYYNNSISFLFNETSVERELIVYVRFAEYIQFGHLE